MWFLEKISLNDLVVSGKNQGGAWGSGWNGGGETDNTHRFLWVNIYFFNANYFSSFILNVLHGFSFLLFCCFYSWIVSFANQLSPATKKWQNFDVAFHNLSVNLSTLLSILFCTYWEKLCCYQTLYFLKHAVEMRKCNINE